jgi:hypothetical protein
VRFPKRIKHRNKLLATIYGKSKAYPFYRVCAYVAGKRRMSSYRTYGEAKSAADTLARDLAKGSQAAALTSTQANDALAALERLQSFRQDTGRKLSLSAVVAEWCDLAKKLNGHTPHEAVDGFLGSVLTIKRIMLHEAIEQFISRPKTAIELRPLAEHWVLAARIRRDFSRPCRVQFDQAAP